MPMKVFSVFDCKAEAYMVPMFMQSRGVAIRSLVRRLRMRSMIFLSTPRIIPFSSLVSSMRLLVSFLLHNTPVSLGKASELKATTRT